MSRSPMRLKAPARWLVAAVLLLASLPTPPSPIAADEIILVPTPFLRKFPAFEFCPFPLELDFIASGSTAKIFVQSNNYVFDSDQGKLVYTHQAIDNIVVVRDSVHALHLLDNNLDPSGPFHPCYAPSPDNTVPFIFKFSEINPSDAPYYELFESGAGTWDVANGAYFDGTRSGPLNVPTDGSSPTPGTGCLGLGQTSAIPSLTDTAKTMVTIGNLIGSKPYVLTGWWRVDEGIITDNVTLTITITGPDQTPLARKTWGSVKARYR